MDPGDIIFQSDGRLKIHVRHGKGGKEGWVTCLKDDYLYEHLKHHIETLQPNERLFYDESYMRKYAWEHGMEMHDFRRAFAVLQKRELLQDGCNAKDADKIVQEQLRHSRFSNTKRYLYGRKIIAKKKKPKEKTEIEDVEPITDVNLEDYSIQEFYDLASELDSRDLTDQEKTLTTGKVLAGISVLADFSKYLLHNNKLIRHEREVLSKFPRTGIAFNIQNRAIEAEQVTQDRIILLINGFQIHCCFRFLFQNTLLDDFIHGGRR